MLSRCRCPGRPVDRSDNRIGGLENGAGREARADRSGGVALRDAGLASHLVDGVALPRPAPQLADRHQDPLPDRIAVHVTLLEQLVGTLSRPERRVFAVLVD
jgi:hypothetical protein